jgi:hypothetical protein
MPYHQRGQVSYQKNRWRMSGGGFMQSYMRIFGQENLGRPDIEIDNEITKLQKYFAKQMDESQIPEIKPLVVFTSDEAEINAENTPIPAMKLKQLKDFIRQRAKEKPIGQLQLAAIKASLPDSPIS